AGPRVVARGIDISSSNLKASLVEIGETVSELAVCTAPTPHEADELVRTATELVRSVLVSAPEAPAAIGIASMAESGVPLGPDDESLGPVLRWDGDDDPRDLDEVLSALGREEVFAATGVPT